MSDQNILKVLAGNLTIPFNKRLKRLCKNITLPRFFILYIISLSYFKANLSIFLLEFEKFTFIWYNIYMYSKKSVGRYEDAAFYCD